MEKLVLDLNGIEPVPAYFIRPQARGPLPAILYNHAHGSKYVLGKDELVAGRDGLQKPPYADALAQRGYAVLCIDAWAFGERRGRSESELFKEMLWTGRVTWGMMVYDILKFLDKPSIFWYLIGTATGTDTGSGTRPARFPLVSGCVGSCR